MKVSEVLTKAADHIEEVGWYQGRFAFDIFDGERLPCCAWGAINFAVGGHPYSTEWSETTVEMESLVQQSLNVVTRALDVKSVPAWNDGDRTLQEVVKGLRDSAKLAIDLGV